MTTDVRQFVLAVVRHWQGYVTGGAVMALLAVYDAAGGMLARWYYLVLFLAAFFPLSCFLAWRDQARLARQLDDRRAQQAKADEYAPLLQQGRRIMVKWVAASLQEPPPEISFGNRSPVFSELETGREAAIAEHRAAAFAWSAEVKAKVEGDFGPAVGVRFNLGKPASVALGVSEPEEHQARVVFLDGLIADMRAGLLPLRVRTSYPSNDAWD